MPTLDPKRRHTRPRTAPRLLFRVVCIAGGLIVFCYLWGVIWGTQAREAVVTVVSSPLYVPGALVLGKSLERWSKHRTRIAIVPDKSLGPQYISMLQELGWQVQHVQGLQLPAGQKVDWKFVDMLAKLYAFDMTNFKAVAIVDSDAYLVGSIDPAFGALHFSAAPLAGSMPPVRLVVDKTGDQFAGHFNGGFLVLKPDKVAFRDLLIKSANGTYYDTSLAEQNLLNTYFAGRWLGLPAVYNLLFMFRERTGYWEALRADAKVIHFAGSAKPWHICEQHESMCGDLHPDVSNWRRLFRELVLEHGWSASDFPIEETAMDVIELLEP